MRVTLRSTFVLGFALLLPACWHAGDRPQTMLFHGDQFVRDFAPAEISGLAESLDGGVAVALRCATDVPERHAGLVVLDAGWNEVGNYSIDLTPIGPDSKRPHAITALRWRASGDLWALSEVYEPRFTRRPLLCST